MFFVGWECVAVYNADVIVCDDCYRIVHIFDGFKDIGVYFGWIYGGVLVFWTDIEGAFCGESVFEYSAVVVCSMRRLQTVFCSLPARTSGSVLMLTLSFLVFF